MRNHHTLALVSTFALSLAACSGAPAEEEAAAPDAAEEPSEVEADTTADAPAVDATPQLASMEPPASFGTCGVCHSVEEGENRVGPHLAGVVGRAAGSVEGANYTLGMQNSGITWDEATLQRYLENPNDVVAGSSMPSPGLSADEVREVVDYLKTL